MDFITPDWLFAQADLQQCGSSEWGQPLGERGSGVYIITNIDDAAVGPIIVYIGRAKSLARRLREFYRHRHGAKGPHRGGQDILLLPGQKIVHWARTEQYGEAERLMLVGFEGRFGRLPWGNRIRSARMDTTPH